jgi:hypothetical protein
MTDLEIILIRLLGIQAGALRWLVTRKSSAPMTFIGPPQNRQANGSRGMRALTMTH